MHERRCRLERPEEISIALGVTSKKALRAAADDQIEPSQAGRPALALGAPIRLERSVRAGTELPREPLWLPERQEISMLDSGFMTDRSDFLAAATPDAKRLSELADVDCLVLIGEPGLGKTTELKGEYRRIGTSLPGRRPRAAG
jgi:hypothetical protein